MSKITLCGDNCELCPRYLAKTEEDLQKVAELWCRVGWREEVLSPEEIKCGGCSSHKSCTFHLVECIKEQGVEKCNQCKEFPCKKIENMLERTKESKRICKETCKKEDYEQIAHAFFEKEKNLLL